MGEPASTRTYLCKCLLGCASQAISERLRDHSFGGKAATVGQAGFRVVPLWRLACCGSATRAGARGGAVSVGCSGWGVSLPGRLGDPVGQAPGVLNPSHGISERTSTGAERPAFERERAEVDRV